MKLPNLLPIKYKKAYRVYLALSYLRNFLAWQFLILIFVGSVFLALQTFYSMRLQALTKSEKNLQATQAKINIDDIKNLAAKQNDQLKASAAVLKVRPTLSLLLEDFSNRIPADVTLDSLKIDPLTSTIKVAGRAATRDKVVLFQNQLEQSKLWTLTFAPLSNLTESKDAPFSFILKFNLKDVTKIQ